MDTFDLIVIGGGPAGYVAAIRAAQLGMKTACVEKRNALGGTCLNVGCIPSKALLDSSEHFTLAQHKFQKHGIELSGVKLNLSQMMARKNEVVKSLTQGVAGLFKKNKIEWVQGYGRFAGQSGGMTQVEVDNAGAKKTIQAKNILIATGSEVIELPTLRFNGKTIVSSTEALDLPAVPGHLVVVGGGVIGLELGSVWKRLGAKVTVVEFAEKILSMMDHQIAGEAAKSLTKQGLEFKLNTQAMGAKQSGAKMQLEVMNRGTQAKETIECDVILVATGRRPFTDGLLLDKIGLKVDEKGRIEINDHFETKVKGIYAVGDVVRGVMLAHKAEEEGIAAVEIMAGQAGHVNYHAIPSIVYTWPEVAGVGYTEEELKAKGVEYKVGTFPFLANGRAKAMDEPEGLVKILADKKTDRVLGMHIFGARASDMIAEGVAVIEFAGSAEDIARSSHAHPTLAEIVKEAALAVDNRKIHL
ncbi:MAG: dihydrolipoyl dehydrogenase [Bdellovibrionales bacterium]|nr:dihydrolipoyl dehydrogenase [Bdellovibrionales bacterium]